MGHWIEESAPQQWTQQHALLGFTQMNTAHNGVRLGQALFKICSRLKIIHKVRLSIRWTSILADSFIRSVTSLATMPPTTTPCWKNSHDVMKKSMTSSLISTSDKFGKYFNLVFVVILNVTYILDTGRISSTLRRKHSSQHVAKQNTIAHMTMSRMRVSLMQIQPR